MKYEIVRDISAPRDAVVDIFTDLRQLKKWQPDLIEIERLNDLEPRTIGAKTMQLHRMGRRKLDIEETITVNQPPSHFAATYEAGKVWNLVENEFSKLAPDKTRWTLVSTMKCRGFMGVMATLFPGMFRRQTEEFMDRFKAYVESSKT